MTHKMKEIYSFGILSTSTPNITEDCPIRHNPEFLVFSLFPTFSVIFNVINFLAIVLSSKKLRRNNVYFYVGNTFLANVVLSLLSLYQILGQYFSVDGHVGQEHGDNQGKARQDTAVWWAFHRALFVALFLVMCCNIGVLVWAIRKRVHRPLLFGSRALELSSSNKKRQKRTRQMVKMISQFDQKRRHRRVWLLIFVTWILPLGHSTTVLGGWSCADTCICLAGCYSVVHENQFTSRHCSRVWPPMRHDWLLISVIAWFLTVAVVVSVLSRAFLDTRRHFLFCRNRMMISAEVSTVALVNKTGSKKQSGKEESGKTHGKHVKHPRNNSLIRSHQVLSQTLKSLRHLIWITVLFVLCTCPMMVLFFIDYSDTAKPTVWVATTCLCVPLVYCCLCPLLLSRCLPGLRFAQRALLLKICKTSHNANDKKAKKLRNSKETVVLKKKTPLSPSKLTVAFRASHN